MSQEMTIGVMKGGSSSFENRSGNGIHQPYVDRFVGYSCELQESGLVTATALVASGARLSGIEYCEERGISVEDMTSLELCRRGTKRQMDHFERAGDLHGVEVTQVLATNKGIDDSREGVFLKTEIQKDLSRGARPVINENPSTAGEETQAMDESQTDEDEDAEDFQPENTGLAAHVAVALWAKYLIVLSGVDGFKRKDGRVVEQISVEEIEGLLEVHAGEKSNSGTGGIKKTMRALASAADSNRVGEVIFGNADRSPVDMIMGRCICTRVVQ